MIFCKIWISSFKDRKGNYWYISNCVFTQIKFYQVYHVYHVYQVYQIYQVYQVYQVYHVYQVYQIYL